MSEFGSPLFHPWNDPQQERPFERPVEVEMGWVNPHDYANQSDYYAAAVSEDIRRQQELEATSSIPRVERTDIEDEPSRIIEARCHGLGMENYEKMKSMGLSLPETMTGIQQLIALQAGWKTEVVTQARRIEISSGEPLGGYTRFLRKGKLIELYRPYWELNGGQDLETYAFLFGKVFSVESGSYDLKLCDEEKSISEATNLLYNVAKEFNVTLKRGDY